VRPGGQKIKGQGIWGNANVLQGQQYPSITICFPNERSVVVSATVPPARDAYISWSQEWNRDWDSYGKRVRSVCISGKIEGIVMAR